MTNGHFRPSRRGPNPEYNSVTTDELPNRANKVFLLTGSHGYKEYDATQSAIEQAYQDIDQTSGDINDSGTIFLPPEADIDISSTLDFGDNTTRHRGFGFVGDYGVAASTIPNTKLSSSITDGSDVLVIDVADSFRFEGITVVGEGTNDGDGIVFKVGGADTATWERIGVKNSGGRGIYISGGGDLVLRDAMVTEAGKSGIRMDSGLALESVESENSSDFGIEVRNHDCTIRECVAEGSGNSGFLFDGKNILAINCQTQTGNGAWGYRWNESNGNGPGMMLKCQTNGSNSNGAVQVNKYSDLLIDGCVFNADSGTDHIRITNNAARVVVRRTRLEGAGTEFNIDSGALDIYISDDVGSTRINGAIGASPSSGSLSLSFDTMFTHKPYLAVNVEQKAIWGVTSWSTDASGNYTGATLSYEDNAGNAVSPTTHWKAIPRNVGVV